MAAAQTDDKPRTAFVTGGTGFLGLVLIDELLSRGWQVTALHRPTADLKYLKQRDVTLAKGDILDIDGLRRAMPDNPDAVFHVAANINMWSRRNAEQTRDNVDGTHNMVSVALEKGAKKFIHTSTISVYGLQKGKINENAPKLGRESWINYQRSKYLAEQEVLRGVEHGLDATMLNPCNIVGAYDTGGWARMFGMVIRDELPGVPPGENSFCDVREVAKAHVEAVDRGKTGENYLLGGIDATYLDMIRVIGELTGKKVPGKALPAWLVRTVGKLRHWRSYLTGRPPTLTPEMARLTTRHLFADSAKAERELGYKAVPLRDMLKESYDWLKRENLLPEG